MTAKYPLKNVMSTLKRGWRDLDELYKIKRKQVSTIMNEISVNLSWLDRLNIFRRLRLVELQIKAKEQYLEDFINWMDAQYPLEEQTQ